MFRALTIVVGALAVVAAAAPQPQQPSQARPYLTPEQREAILKMPAMSEDKRVNVDEIDALIASGDVVFLDVREPKELEDFGTLEGYVNIPLLQLEDRLSELPKDKAILTA